MQDEKCGWTCFNFVYYVDSIEVLVENVKMFESNFIFELTF